MKEKTGASRKRSAALSAAAIITAAGVLTSGLFQSPADLLSRDAALPDTACVDTLIPDGDDGDPDDSPEMEEEKNRKRGLRAGARELLLRLPLAVRLLVLLPLWLLGSGMTALGGALWTAASPWLSGLLGFALLSLLLAGAFLLAVKTAFPNLPLRKIMNWRTLPALLLGAAALTAADAVLSVAWPEYAELRRAVVSTGFLAVLSATTVTFSLREKKRRERVPTAVEGTAPPDRLCFTDRSGDFTVRTGR